MWNTEPSYDADTLLPVPQPIREQQLRNRPATLGMVYGAAVTTRDTHTYPGLPATWDGYTDGWTLAANPYYLPNARPIPDIHQGLPASLQEYGR